MTINPTFLANDPVAAARVRLVGALVGASMVPSVVGADGQAGQPVGPYSDAWVFPAIGDTGAPPRNIEGTGKALITLTARNEWAVNHHNTARFPILWVLIYADNSRDALGNTAARDSELRCKAVAKVVDKVFHDAANESHAAWKAAGLDIHSCVRLGGLSITDMINGDGAVRGDIKYELAID